MRGRRQCKTVEFLPQSNNNNTRIVLIISLTILMSIPSHIVIFTSMQCEHDVLNYMFLTNFEKQRTPGHV